MGFYKFNNCIYDSFLELVYAMAYYWNEGKEFLYSGELREQIKAAIAQGEGESESSIAGFIEADQSDAGTVALPPALKEKGELVLPDEGGPDDPAFLRQILRNCVYAEKAYQADFSRRNVLYLRWLIKIPGMKHVYWMGRDFGNLEELSILLARGPGADVEHVLQLLLSEALMGDLARNSGRSESTVENIRYIEESLRKENTRFDRKNALPLLSYVLSENRMFSFDDKVFLEVNELSDYMQDFADDSKKAISSKVNGLMQGKYNLTPEFEAWLLNLGYRKELYGWKRKFQE